MSNATGSTSRELRLPANPAEEAAKVCMGQVAGDIAHALAKKNFFAYSHLGKLGEF